MNARALAIPEVILLEPNVFYDERGYFFESFNQAKFAQIIGRNIAFVQDNQSHSKQGVLRGLHYQHHHPQAKLVGVLSGEIFDVAIDLRRHSVTYGQWVGEILSAENRRQLWIPEGFAHGFLVLSEAANVHYKVTDHWYADDERCIRFDDPHLNITWPTSVEPILSAKDQAGVFLSDLT